jgi:hypothetical protein
MKGIVTFYINYHPDLGQDLVQTIEVFKQVNKDLFEAIQNESEYRVAVVPTTKEACRIEKVDFDKAFPRFVPRTHSDLEYLERRKEERAKEREMVYRELVEREKKSSKVSE